MTGYNEVEKIEVINGESQKSLNTNKSRTKRSYIHNECNKQL